MRNLISLYILKHGLIQLFVLVFYTNSKKLQKVKRQQSINDSNIFRKSV